MSRINNKVYDVAPDGTVFSVNEDGSITKYATFDDNGVLRANDRAIAGRRRPVWGYWLAILILLLVCGTVAWLYISASDNNDRLKSESATNNVAINRLETAVEQLETDLKQAHDDEAALQARLDTITSLVVPRMPIVIEQISIANSDREGNLISDYGSTIYSNRTMYLKPQIKYYGFKNAQIPIKVKWFWPSGVVMTTSYANGSTLNDFSQSFNCRVYQGAGQTLVLGGWGTSNPGAYWKEGNYRIEIWSDNNCLASKTFAIY